MGGAAFCPKFQVCHAHHLPHDAGSPRHAAGRRCTGARYTSSPAASSASRRPRKHRGAPPTNGGKRQAKLADIPPEDDRMARAARISHLVRDFSRLDDDGRREAVEALLGAGSYDSLKSQAKPIVGRHGSAAPERTVAAQVEAWKTLLRGVCQSGQMSEGRYDAYCRKIGHSPDWSGRSGHRCHRRGEARGVLQPPFRQGRSEGEYSADLRPRTPDDGQAVHPLAGRDEDDRAARQYPTPAGSASTTAPPAKIETFTAEEVRGLLAACDGFSERTKLYLLLMLNCGMYQNDIAELHADEVNWSKGTLTRARSKTRERQRPGRHLQALAGNVRPAEEASG